MAKQIDLGGLSGGSVRTWAWSNARLHAESVGRGDSGDRLIITMSTENLVSNEDLLMLTSVLEQADLPLTKEKIDGMRE